MLACRIDIKTDCAKPSRETKLGTPIKLHRNLSCPQPGLEPLCIAGHRERPVLNNLAIGIARRLEHEIDTAVDAEPFEVWDTLGHRHHVVAIPEIGVSGNGLHAYHRLAVIIEPDFMLLDTEIIVSAERRPEDVLVYPGSADLALRPLAAVP